MAERAGAGNRARDKRQEGEGTVEFAGCEGGQSWSAPPLRASATLKPTAVAQGGSQEQHGSKEGGTTTDTCQVHPPAAATHALHDVDIMLL